MAGYKMCFISLFSVLIFNEHRNFVAADASQDGHCHVVNKKSDDRPEERISGGCGVSPSRPDGPTNKK